jgi:homeobox protein cut-like
LLSTLETQKNTIGEYQEQRSKIETEYTRQIKKLEQEISTLKEKVSQFSDYDEIKRELEIIKVRSLWGMVLITFIRLEN